MTMKFRYVVMDGEKDYEVIVKEISTGFITVLHNYRRMDHASNKLQQIVSGLSKELFKITNKVLVQNNLICCDIETISLIPLSMRNE